MISNHQAIGISFFNETDEIRFGFGPFPANTCHQWELHDSEEKFNLHLKDEKSKNTLELAGWTRDNIRYRINDAGFRMDQNFRDLLPGNCNFYLGCSITFGIGLNLEDTWAWQLNRDLGGSFVNLSWPGGGIEAQYRLLRSWARRFRPRRAYTIGAFPNRREILLGQGKASRLGPWMDGKDLGLYRSLINEDESRISFIRSMDAMRAVCAENDIEFYVPCNQGVIEMQQQEDGDLPARDLMHRGKSWHLRIAKKPMNWWQRLA